MYIQDIILTLVHFWKERGFTFLSSYDTPKGAATFSRDMMFRLASKQNTKLCFVERCARNQDAIYRAGKRLYQHHQFEVMHFASSSSDLLPLYMKSLQKISILPSTHTIEWLEDNWRQTSLSARGFGWEIRCDGVEITQITYFTHIGAISFEDNYPLEFAYGIERIACINQRKNNIFDTMWSSSMSFADMFSEWERQNSDTSRLIDDREMDENISLLDSLLDHCITLLESKRSMLAYDCVVLASSFLNKISSRLQSLLQRKYLSRIEHLVKRILC